MLIFIFYKASHMLKKYTKFFALLSVVDNSVEDEKIKLSFFLCAMAGFSNFLFTIIPAA